MLSVDSTTSDVTERTDADAPATLLEALARTVARRPDEVAITALDGSPSWTWSQLAAAVDEVARGLYDTGGVRAGDTVALMIGNVPEFFLVDLAVLRLGAVPFSIYQTAPQDQIRYMLRDSGATTVLVQAQHAEAVLSAAAELPGLGRTIVVDGEHEGCLTLAEVRSAGAASAVDLEAVAGEVDGDTLLTLIYTSGTTGTSKGVELVHRNVMAAVRATEERIPFPDESRVISWLPAAHVAERVAHYYLPVVFGIQVTCCPNPADIGRALAQVQPTWFFGVPRIWEKLKAGVESIVAADTPESRRLGAAVDSALRTVRLEAAGDPVPPDLADEVARAESELFAPLRRRLGFGGLVVANVGSAPTPREVLEFFHAIGVGLSEIWGMSETCGVGCSNPHDAIRIGTVGPPAPGVELRLAEDGEIQIRSEAVMRGYRNMPERTAETLVDGWLNTGDIGEIDEAGYVRVVDRKKDLIINSAGKNMSPAFIEAELKTASPLIGQACCVGDGRRYNVALLTLDPDVTPVWAAGHGVAVSEVTELATDPVVYAEIEAAVERANAKLSRPEQIKRFHLVAGEFSIAGGELTPSMKLKRSTVLDKYRPQIDALYLG